MKNINRLTSAVNNKRSQQTVKNISPIKKEEQHTYKDQIKLHPQLREWGIQLNEVERSHLKEAIVKAKKVLDPLLLAEIDGQVVLVDGHNRYEIIQELDLPHAAWDVALLPWIKTAQEAIDYMVELQQGRRNWTKQDLSFIRGQAYAHLKDAKQVAQQYKVGEATVFRDYNFFKGISKAPNDVRVAYLHSHDFTEEQFWLSKVGMGQWQKLGQEENTTYEMFIDDLFAQKPKKNKNTVVKPFNAIKKLNQLIEKDLRSCADINIETEQEQEVMRTTIANLERLVAELKGKVE
ncbi:hypothetical protein [Persicobacter psychrovividus]|uniref:ParB/Sulfiredoxin domain-containing protein n=1 Tax=Persicobacter psychrovividus TaxID=387638 RepID=A0ABM7VJM1_9BACT|nr:hypothetical protein PEPS_34500 [Persicobacter psychrovividus]